MGEEHEEGEDGEEEVEEQHDDGHQVADGSHHPEEYHQETDREPSEVVETHPGKRILEILEYLTVAVVQSAQFTRTRRANVKTGR